ncbi:MAG: sugar transporter substrate-binding protein, partial [Ilumatobacteraceae bacterium]|nr:sugar transporter substrate-binding protein [Ilumatobacteraceae bacterium]
MMQRRFARATCLAMVGTFILASCGSDDKSSTATTAAAATTAAPATSAATGSSTATSGSTATTGGASGGTIGVILPDSKSSVRWETADRKYLDAAITAAGFKADIQNAEG